MSEVSAQLKAVVRRFPELAGAEVRVMTSGWDCVALEIAGWTFKFPRNDLALRSLRSEARFLALIRQAARLAVPDLELVEGEVLFSRHRTLPGAQLDTEGYGRLEEGQRQRPAEDLAGFLSDVHRIDPAAARAAGAQAVEAWMPPGEVAGRLAGHLTGEEARVAEAVLREAAGLSPDPAGEVFGQFDGHGWNMAFDPVAGRLNGIYDFGDAGIGGRHRDFVYMGFISYDLTRRALPIYEAETGIRPDPRRIWVLTGWHRLWELVAAEPERRSAHLAPVRAWLAAASA